MKHFKKRTIALVLASVVTVAGSFAASNYKNTLMGLDFANGDSGEVNMVLRTKNAYEGTLNLVRKDANTYVLMLPDINSLAPTPDLNTVGKVDSVDIKTMPYTNSGNGYTKITVHTGNNTKIAAKNEIYIPAKPQPEALSTNDFKDFRPQEQLPKDEPVQEKDVVKNEPSSAPPQSQATVTNENQAPKEMPASIKKVSKKSFSDKEKSGDSTEAFLLVLGVLVIITTSIFLFIKAKNKLVEISGEQIKIDVEDEKEKRKKKEKKEQAEKKKQENIRAAIKNLDKKYPKPSGRMTPIPPVSPVSPVSSTSKIKPEEVNVVDLDKLFLEKTQNDSTGMEENEDENQALEDFLNGFSFDDSAEEVAPEQPEETELFDEELYDKTLNDTSLVFTKDDLDKINKLLNTEINDSTLKHISEFAVSNPIKKEPSKQERLEHFVTSYAISQNITFTKEDVNALYKLINVEIDNDFLTDLRTNPERAKELAQEISRKKSRPHKSTEILTLSVKDMLPDLSEALRKQGDKRIESEVKPEVVYYSEGYDVSTISLKEQLPDLSVEINKEESYVSKPSAEIKLAESGYDVQTLNASDLPDLSDVLAHPEKYAEPEPEEVKVDEEALLKNITNVQFKPFYDGSEEIEVINDFGENKTSDEKAPSVSEIQEEFNQFGDIEIPQEEAEENVPIRDEYDDFEALYNNEFVDLDKNKSEPKVPDGTQIKSDVVESVSKQEFVPVKLERQVECVKREHKTEDLVRKIEQTRVEREARKAKIASQKVELKAKEVSTEKNCRVSKCILGGMSYSVVSSISFDSNKGCYLVKNDSGYAVIGYVGEKLIELKKYKTLKSEKIQSRVSETLEGGALRCLVRIGLQKFIVDVVDDDIKYVMDLC